MNPLVPGLGESGKMSSSEPNSKIDFDDTDKQIKKKINKSYCQDGVVNGNGILAMLKYILFKKVNKENREFVIDRPEEYGGKISFKTYEEVEKSFASKELSSIDLKQGIIIEMINFITPLRTILEENKNLFDGAYSHK